MIVPREIRTERLLLRRHRSADLDAFVSFLLHPSATRYMSFTADQRTGEGARELLDAVIASYATSDPILSLTIADPNTDEYIGSCGASPDEHEIEIYYTILHDRQGSGFAKEATRALLEHLKPTTDTTFVAYVVPENIASVRVAERLGFVDVGPGHRQAASSGLRHDALNGRKYALRR